jgi:hypothetical protein
MVQDFPTLSCHGRMLRKSHFQLRNCLQITPTNEHYLLLHWEVPETDAASWRLVIGGKNPLRLSIADIRARPAATVTVTLECAGNGRAFVAPRRISNPWHTEAVSTAVWTGVVRIAFCFFLPFLCSIIPFLFKDTTFLNLACTVAWCMKYIEFDVS